MPAQAAGVVEYTDSISAERYDTLNALTEYDI